MKRIILTTALLFAGLIYGQTADPPSNYGNVDAGTSANPYQIATLNNLYWISDQVNNSHNLFTGKYFIQTNDINAAPCSTWFSNTGFLPIGNDSYPFEGNYDGQNHVISWICIYHHDYASGGFALFGRTNGSSISNLGMTYARVHSLYGIPAVLCGINNGSVTNCYSTGIYVELGYGAGGLIGQNDGGNITNCYSTIPVQNAGNNTGGLIGTLNGGNVNNCYYNGIITIWAEGGNDIGGLVGSMYGGTITNSYSNGSVDNSTAYGIGGLVGEVYSGSISYSFSSFNIGALFGAGGFCSNSDGFINDCYASGNVYGYDVSELFIGGFIGGNSGTVTNCYSIGSVTPSISPFGGFDADPGSRNIINCFYNKDVVATSVNATGKTTLEMKDQATYTSWDFTNRWAINTSINNGYPYLIQKVAITGANLLSSGIAPGTSKPIVSLVFSSVLGVPYITSIKVDRTGTATDLDIPSASLWIDNNKNNIVDNTDVQLGTTQNFSSGTLTFSGLNYWPCTINNLLIVFNADPGANISHTAGVSILSNYITGTNTTGITFTGITAGEQLLPVEITSFTANNVINGVELKWQTAAEVNNYGFDVERSLPPNPLPKEGGVAPLPLGKGLGDGLWEKIGFVQGSGNSNSLKQYSFVDLNPPAGNLQYRLKQIDTEGGFKYYSNIAEVNFSLTGVREKQLPSGFTLEQNYPNPFNPVTVIRFGLPSESKVTLEIYNVIGERVTQLVNNVLDAGYHDVKCQMNGIPSGIYFYRINAKDVVGNKEFHSIKKMLYLK